MKTISEIFMAEADKRDGSTYETWCAALKKWQAYAAGEICTVDGFRRYLLATCGSVGTASTYWSKFRAVASIAMQKGIIPEEKFLPISAKQPHRDHLEWSEVQTLAKTDCEVPELKQMAMFSILTGLRWSDIAALKRSDLKLTDDGWVIQYRQQKTGALQYHPITEQAYELLPEGDGKLFQLRYSSHLNKALRAWLQAAGITRKLGFHAVGRHTFAVKALDEEVEIYTLSKLLGHTQVKTTEIYAEISDKKKMQAAQRIKL